MDSDITVYKINDVYMQAVCPRSISSELTDFFTFKVPGYQFNPKYKAKIWDGNIRLHNTYTGNLYTGLYEYLNIFCEERGYTISYENNFNKNENITEEDVSKLINNYFSRIKCLDKKTGKWEYIKPYDYQLHAIYQALSKKRLLLLAATSAGKSLILYLISRILLMQGKAKRILIITPTVSLVNQTAADFLEYANDDIFFNEDNIHKIYEGQNKKIKKDITFSTWQSLQHESEEFLSQFDACFIDEAHTVKAKSLISINEKMKNCPYKIGVTGTIDEAETNKLVLVGLLGPIVPIISARQLIDSGRAPEMKINSLILSYPEEEKKHVKTLNYQEELSYIISHKRRNNFIKNLVLGLKSNALILFERVEEHGIPLYEDIKKSVGEGRNVYLIHGHIDADEREEIRKKFERDTNGIIIASFGTFSTGINIKNIHHIIFASPSKSFNRICQSIGRGLRKTATKTLITIWDIIDDLSIKKYQNYIYKHGLIRLEIYHKEKHTYKLYKFNV